MAEGLMEIRLISITPDAESVIEAAARVCYQSNSNVTDDSAASFLPKLLAMGHTSPFEHASASFMISGCSRAMTHQLVRHRLMSFSQKSQRYVREDGFEYVVPPSIGEEHLEEYRKDMAVIQEMYAKWKSAGIRNEDARFVLPNACATEIMITANFREYMHVFDVRCSPHAQWEIREACEIMRDILREHAPNIFK